MQLYASIPSPTRAVWHLGPLPVRAYALCIIVGILVAIWLTTRRWVARGGNPDHVWDIGAWAIVLGIIGGRLYHLATDPELYFEGKPGTHPINAFKIWDGGLGIWGAIALGFAGAWIACRRRRIRISVFADCAVPGIIIAQAIGRLGNWFNNELYGRPTSLPWGLTVHCINGDTNNGPYSCNAHGDVVNAAGTVLHFQPTFLYELIWDLAIGVALLLLDRRFKLGRGNVMALYAMGYTVGRAWVEYLRIDTANHFLGLRLNDWTSLVVFLGGLAWFLRHGAFHSGREDSPYYDQVAGSGEPAAAAEDEAAAEPTADQRDDTADQSDDEVTADGGVDR